MYYLNPKTNQIAKVLNVDERTGMATVVIDDKSTQMVWADFVCEFKYLTKDKGVNHEL